MKNRLAASFVIVSWLILAGPSSLLFAQSWKDKENDEPITIGVLGPLSGTFAPLFRPSRLAIELAVNSTNSAGGISGQPLRLIFADTQGASQVALEAAKKLVHDDKVAALIGGFMNREALAVLPIGSDSEIPFFVFNADHPAITRRGHAHIFRNAVSAELIYGNLVDYVIKRRKLKRFALLGPKTFYSESLAKVVADISAKPKGKASFVASLFYESGRQDFTSVLEELRAKKPEVVVLSGTTSESGLIVRQAGKLGMSVQFLGEASLVHPFFASIAGKYAAGVLLGTGFQKGQLKSQLARTLQKSWQDMKAPEDLWYPFAYEAAVILIEALKGIQLTGTKLIDQLHREEFRGLSGNLRFLDNGEVTRPIFISEWQGGGYLQAVGSLEWFSAER